MSAQESAVAVYWQSPAACAKRLTDASPPAGSESYKAAHPQFGFISVPSASHQRSGFISGRKRRRPAISSLAFSALFPGVGAPLRNAPTRSLKLYRVAPRTGN